MIPYEEALRLALATVRPGAAVEVPLADAVGGVLAADVRSDTDLPPFDRSAMDGYAVRAADVAAPGARLDVVVTVAAGDRPDVAVGRGQAARIFTGAAVPEGADTVVMQEVTERSADGATVTFKGACVRGENVSLRGEDIREGDVALRAGALVRAPEVSLAAAVGRATLPVHARPRIGIVSTGDELVPPGSPPAYGRIRDANGPALVARLRAAGFDAAHLGIVADDRDAIREILARALEYDCAIVSAGVSVGDRDLVPEVLGDLGVEFVFTRVAMKPGKPTKLGVRGERLVLGLPGNPASALVAIEVLFLPMLLKTAGHGDPPPRGKGVLTGPVRKKAGRRLFTPAMVESGSGGATRVVPVECHGSADLVAVRNSNAYLTLTAEATAAEAGDEVEYHVRSD